MPRTARTCARGAALVETLIVAPLLVLSRCALSVASDMYGRKLATRGEARALAWEHALSSCEGGSASTADAEGTNLDAVVADRESVEGAALTDEGRELADNARGTGDLELGDSWGVAEASQSSDPWRSYPPFARERVASTFEVQCDEKPRGADPVSVLSFLWDLRNTVRFD
jgi:hypothetical protein